MKKHNYSGYFREHIWSIIWLIACMVIAKACRFTISHVLSDIVAEVKETHFTMSSILISVKFIFGLGLAYALFNFLSNYRATDVQTLVSKRIYNELARIISKSTPETVKKNSSVELSEYMNECSTYTNSVYELYRQILVIVLGISALVYTFVCSWIIGVMFVVIFLIYLVVQYVLIKRQVKKYREAKNASDNNKKLLVEILEAFPDIKTLSLLGGLYPHFSKATDKRYATSVDSENIQTRNELYTDILLTFYQGAFLLVSAFLLTNDALSLANFVALYMYRNDVYGMIGAILSIVKYQSFITTSTERMDKIFEYEIVSQEKFGDVKMYPIKGDLSIKNLAVSYDETPILKDVSLDIPAGKFVVIAGKSGCGKSTLLNVLARQVTPSSGTITIDGVNMFDLAEWTYHKAVTLTPQFPVMFSMSLRDNLCLANPKATDTDIEWALGECSASNISSKLDTVIPSELSGGQRQRLALARTALRGGRILLLDESTSSLDALSEKHIIETIRKATKGGHTVILVSHKSAPIKAADTVIYMEDGKIAAQGTYDEVYRNAPAFANLID